MGMGTRNQEQTKNANWVETIQGLTWSRGKALGDIGPGWGEVDNGILAMMRTGMGQEIEGRN